MTKYVCNCSSCGRNNVFIVPTLKRRGTQLLLTAAAVEKTRDQVICSESRSGDVRTRDRNDLRSHSSVPPFLFLLLWDLVGVLMGSSGGIPQHPAGLPMGLHGILQDPRRDPRGFPHGIPRDFSLWEFPREGPWDIPYKSHMSSR